MSEWVTLDEPKVPDLCSALALYMLIDGHSGSEVEARVGAMREAHDAQVRAEATAAVAARVETQFHVAECDDPGSVMPWYCPDCDLYMEAEGECPVNHGLRAALTPDAGDALRSREAKALRDAAEEVRGSVSPGFGMRHDGTEDPQAAAYVEGLHDAYRIVRDRADALEARSEA